jgi:hypothetical protein
MQIKKPAVKDAEDRQALLNCLSVHPVQKFRAAQLKEATGVPKSRVRALLAGLSQVVITTGTTKRIPERASKGVGVTQEAKIYWYKWQK